MPSLMPQSSTPWIWWESELEGGPFILVAMLHRHGRSAGLHGDSCDAPARHRDLLGGLLRWCVWRPTGICASRYRRRIGLASLRDFPEGRSGAHAAHGAD